MTQNSFKTPWGPALSISTIANGIYHCDTASHHGYYLSPKRFEQMPACTRDTFAGGPWYEGNDDANLVICVFPQYWPDFIVDGARRRLQRNRPGIYRQLYGPVPAPQLVA